MYHTHTFLQQLGQFRSSNIATGYYNSQTRTLTLAVHAWKMSTVITGPQIWSLSVIQSDPKTFVTFNTTNSDWPPHYNTMYLASVYLLFITSFTLSSKCFTTTSTKSDPETQLLANDTFQLCIQLTPEPFYLKEAEPLHQITALQTFFPHFFSSSLFSPNTRSRGSELTLGVPHNTMPLSCQSPV